MLIPLKTKYVISSRFGYRRDPFVRSVRKFHSGVDFAVPRGTPVYAAASGVVKTAGWHGGYGRFIKIKHNGNIATAYGHLSKILVKSGQSVKKGQLIGKVGSTGRSTNPHLHFEIRKGSKRVNPLKNVSLPVRSLRGQDKKRFDILRNAIMRRVEGIPSRTEVVAASAP
jgi:murein DD-endopeptidase MepM/ murein hydrolase activator NlpD